MSRFSKVSYEVIRVVFLKKNFIRFLSLQNMGQPNINLPTFLKFYPLIVEKKSYFLILRQQSFAPVKFPYPKNKFPFDKGKFKLAHNSYVKRTY